MSVGGSAPRTYAKVLTYSSLGYTSVVPDVISTSLFSRAQNNLYDLAEAPDLHRGRLQLFVREGAPLTKENTDILGRRRIELVIRL